MKRILIYSHDTFGLGNIRRMLSIARHLVENQEDYSVLLLSGSPMLHAFRIPQQIDYVKLPCLQRDQAGNYGVRSLALNLDDTVKLRSNIILSTVLDYQPDIMIVDKKPLGINRELAPALERLKRRANAPAMILLLRDILDNPVVTQNIWHKRGYFDAIDDYYDRVLVVGEREIFDLAREYHFPAAAAKKLQYCGYIRREPGLRDAQSIRSELDIGEQKLVLLTLGGGKDGTRLLLNYLQGLRQAQASQFHSMILCGPEMEEDCKSVVKELAGQQANLTLRNFTDDLMSYMNAADVVVSMCGYNTVCEILTLNKPAVVVPRVTPVQEQWIRAEKMQTMGLMAAIHPDELTPAKLLKAVKYQLNCPVTVVKQYNSRPQMDALPNIKTIVEQQLIRRKRTESQKATNGQWSNVTDLPVKSLNALSPSISYLERIAS